MVIPMNDVKEKLIKKYATKSVEQMVKEQDELQEDVATEAMELDSKLRNFSSQIDPIKSDTGEILAYAKRPSAAQYERLIPPKFLKYRDNPNELPIEEAMAYSEDMYNLMEELIVRPFHNAKEWKEMIGDDFLAAFQAHFVRVREEASKTVARFLQPVTDSTK